MWKTWIIDYASLKYKNKKIWNCFAEAQVKQINSSLILFYVLLCYSFWEPFTPVVADSFSVEFEWPQVSLNLWDSSKYSVLLLINKEKICQIVVVCRFTKQKDRQILGSCLRVEKVMGHKSDDDNNSSWCRWNGPQISGKETRETGDLWKNRDHPYHGNVRIS